MADKSVLKGAFKNSGEIIIAVGVIAMILMLIMPLPTLLLDTLMACNLALSLLILLIVLYTKRAIDFNLFPTMLLISTVFGLALNVSSTRLILSQGQNFNGKMVSAFASFVVGGAEGNEGLIVGFVIFIILIAVQAMVITKGASRVAEVAARFTLDSMNSKMMAVDSELNSGAITEEVARQRKIDIQKESDFYGSMDGASKFVSGNVKVGIVITIINLLGGILIGVFLHEESFNSAISQYARFTIGDGLLSQLPSLMVSVATGLIVTRSVSDGNLATDMQKQFTRDSKIYFIIAALLLFMSFLPGFPTVVLLMLSFALGFLGWKLSQKEKASFAKEMEKAKSGSTAKKSDSAQKLAAASPPDILSLELGYSLVPLVDKGSVLIERIGMIRNETAYDLGITIPSIRITDNIGIDPGDYRFKIRGAEVGRGTVRMGAFLCMNPQGSIDIPGEKTVEPSFGLAAVWVSEENRELAERNGYTVVDPPSMIATHITKIIREHADELVGRQEVQAMIDVVRKDYPAVVDEVIGPNSTNRFDLGQIQKVLQGLLREQVSIRNFIEILEALADFGSISKDPYFLVEKVRQKLSRQICLQYADEDHVIHVVTIDPSFEEKLVESRVDTASGPVSGLDLQTNQAWLQAVNLVFANVHDMGYLPVILCSEAARLLVKRSTENEYPGLIVLSVPEINKDVKVTNIGIIKV